MLEITFVIENRPEGGYSAFVKEYPEAKGSGPYRITAIREATDELYRMMADEDENGFVTAEEWMAKRRG